MAKRTKLADSSAVTAPDELQHEAPAKHAGGRPSSLRPEYVGIAQALATRGATDAEIADALSVSVRTIYRWKGESDEFCQALNVGKALPDDRVERSLYQRATGYDFVEQQAFKVKTGPHEEKVEVVDVVRHQPGDTTAQIFWLKNRRRDDWRDRVEHSGPNGGAITFAQQRTIAAEKLRDLSPDERQMLRQMLLTAQQELDETDAIDADYEVRDE